MRGIVIAKMLVLTLWGLYLAIGLTQGAGSDERRASSEMLTLASRCHPGACHRDPSDRARRSWLRCGSRQPSAFAEGRQVPG
jgi:hypothetical protein